MRRNLTFDVRGAKRVGGFAASIFLQAAASLALVPAIISAAGLETWSSIVLGQALALIVATVVGLGYGITGPAVIATRTLAEGVSYFRLANRTRFVVAVPCFVLMIGAMFIIPNHDPIAGLLGGANIAIGGFTAGFFYVGRAAPLWLLLAETVPRVLLTVIGAIILALGAPLLIGLALPALGAALGIAVSYFTIRMSVGQTTPKGESPKLTGVRAELRDQIAPATSALFSGGRDALPVLVVTAVAAELVGAFGVFDRFRRQANAAGSPVAVTLQGWVPRRMVTDSSARAAVAALLAGLAAAFASFLLLTLLGSPIIKWLSAGTLTPTCVEILLLSAAVGLSMLIQVVNQACLVPLVGIRGVFVANLAGVIAIPIASFVMLSFERSVEYVLGALVVAYVFQLFLQLLQMRHSIARGSFRMGVDD